MTDPTNLVHATIRQNTAAHIDDSRGEALVTRTRTIPALHLMAAGLALALGVASSGAACTALIAGKGTTADGSLLFAKTEDDGVRTVDYLWFVERELHPPGDVVQLRAGGTVPQAPRTFAFLWDQPPKRPYSSFLVNEWGVAFGSNSCPSREDAVEIVEERGDLKDGGLEFMLRFILAQRARTAREAVDLAAGLLDEYGYRASGRSLAIVGPHEAWQLQMVRGKQYVARRVRDGEVALTANTYSIHSVDTTDGDNFVCSPRLIDYAVERGWYDPETDGPFDFAAAYASREARTHPANTHRVWGMVRRLAGDGLLSLDEAERGALPTSVAPNRTLTPIDIMDIMRDHYEGTELAVQGETPHRNRARTICTYKTHRTTVVQQRPWLPPDIGTVVWRALGPPCSSGFVPWYLGARDVPRAFRNAPESLSTTARGLLDFQFAPPEEVVELDRDSAACVFGLLGGLVDADYAVLHESVRRRWSSFERRAFEMLPTIDAAATELYRTDPVSARRFLSDHVGAMAGESLAIARRLVDAIEWNLWGTGLGNGLRLPVDVDPEVLRRYTGRYRVDGEEPFRITLDGGKLWMILDTGIKLAITPLSETELFVREADLEMRFLADEAGEVVTVVLGTGEDALTAERIGSP